MKYSGEWTVRGALKHDGLFTLNGPDDDQLYLPVGAEGWKDGCNAFNLTTREFESIPAHWAVFEIDFPRSRANWEAADAD
jgi:hypothetical protein